VAAWLLDADSGIDGARCGPTEELGRALVSLADRYGDIEFGNGLRCKLLRGRDGKTDKEEECDPKKRAGGNAHGVLLLEPPNDIEFTGEKEGARATDAESGAMRC
jgi:hypothetical protein